MKGILSSKKIKFDGGKIFGSCGTPTLPGPYGVSIADISVDDPMMSPTKDVGEVIGKDVMLDLHENIAQLTDRLETERQVKFTSIRKLSFQSIVARY